jgi:hypothetical protein
MKHFKVLAFGRLPHGVHVEFSATANLRFEWIDKAPESAYYE